MKTICQINFKQKAIVLVIFQVVHDSLINALNAR